MEREICDALLSLKKGDCLLGWPLVLEVKKGVGNVLVQVVPFSPVPLSLNSNFFKARLSKVATGSSRYFFDVDFEMAARTIDSSGIKIS